MPLHGDRLQGNDSPRLLAAGDAYFSPRCQGEALKEQGLPCHGKPSTQLCSTPVVVVWSCSTGGTLLPLAEKF